MKKENLLYVHFSNHWMIKGSSDGAGSAGKGPFLENLTSNTVLVQHGFFPRHQQHDFYFVPASKRWLLLCSGINSKDDLFMKYLSSKSRFFTRQSHISQVSTTLLTE